MSFFSKAFNALGIGKVFGMNKQPDLGAAFDKQLQAQREAAKLQAANETTNVAQFSGTDPTLSVGTDMRRKKQTAGAYATGLGLNI